MITCCSTGSNYQLIPGSACPSNLTVYFLRFFTKISKSYTALWLELVSLFLVVSDQSDMLTEDSVQWHDSETAGDDQSIHSELQIAILFIVFFSSLVDFVLLILERIVSGGFFFGTNVSEVKVS